MCLMVLEIKYTERQTEITSVFRLRSDNENIWNLQASMLNGAWQLVFIRWTIE